MNREDEITELKEKLQIAQIEVKHYKDTIKKLEEGENLKKSLLWGALEGVETIEGGYDDGEIKIDLEIKEKTVKRQGKEHEVRKLICYVTSEYYIDGITKKEIKTYLSDFFEISKVAVFTHAKPKK